MLKLSHIILEKRPILKVYVITLTFISISGIMKRMKNTTTNSIDQSFKDIESMQERDFIRLSSERARSMSDQNYSQSEENQEVQPPKRSKKLLKALSVAAVVGTGLAGGKAIFDQYSPPTFSSETTTYTVNPGDGLLDVAEQIEGLGDSREGVSHITKMPENQEALSDGLQPGETIVIPVDANK